MPRGAREGEERGRGIPYNDLERVCRHYDICPEEYYEHPAWYPLEERGYGLTIGQATTSYAWIWPILLFGAAISLVAAGVGKKLGV